jgi:diadenosine tetraphosphate (Ap4A) HIT family hydrolase
MLASYPRERLAHILLIPNQEYQHLGTTLTAPFFPSDVARTEAIMEQAQKLARQLHLSDVKIFENSAQSVSVGYQHIHLIGIHDPAHPYPPPLPSRNSGSPAQASAP